MSNLPEQIWADCTTIIEGQWWRMDWTHGEWQSSPDGGPIRYLRDDLCITRAEADRMVAEAVAREWAILTEAIETYFDATAVWDVESHAARIRARKGGAA